jgi:hypothetical protein
VIAGAFDLIINSGALDELLFGLCHGRKAMTDFVLPLAVKSAADFDPRKFGNENHGTGAPRPRAPHPKIDRPPPREKPTRNYFPRG